MHFPNRAAILPLLVFVFISLPTPVLAQTGASDPALAADDPFAVPAEIRDAGWKEVPASRIDAQGLEAFAYRLGSWITEKWRDDERGRHKIRIVYEWHLDERVLRGRSFKVYEDGSEELYLDEFLFEHGDEDAVAAHLYFDDTYNGLFADALWIVDEGGYERLDCDLISPRGGKGQVRDFFRPVGDDRMLWTTYSIHEGAVSDPEPAERITLIRESQ